MADTPSFRTRAETFRPLLADGWPLWRLDDAEYAIVYAPGYVCIVDLPHADWLQAILGPPDLANRQLGAAGPAVDAGSRCNALVCNAELWRHAGLAVADTAMQQIGPFQPECLTLYLSNSCNLSCVYCHVDPCSTSTQFLDPHEVEEAARVVAHHCRQRRRPLFLVFHGGGEPTQDRRLVERMMTCVRKIAEVAGIELIRYVATNAVMSVEKARWLSSNFDLIGVSCDGPPDIQNLQRPLHSGRATAHIVERTASVLHEEGSRLHVRSTITRSTLRRQAEIADYLCRRFSPEEIHFEPAYTGGRSCVGFTPQEAGEFVAQFLTAQEVTERKHVRLLYSGSRLSSLYGSYCNVFRSVLNLVPGGVATACFKLSDPAVVERRGAKIGAMTTSGCFAVDDCQLERARRALQVMRPECLSCFNRYHCTKGCPDWCPLGRGGSELMSPARAQFRCYVQESLSRAAILNVARGLWEANRSRRTGETSCTVLGTSLD